jgi:hypothetical protein
VPRGEGGEVRERARKRIEICDVIKKIKGIGI